MITPACTDDVLEIEDVVGTWTIDQMHTDSYPEGVIDSSWEGHPTVSFSIPARVSGTTGCGDYSARFSLDGDLITLEGLVHYGVECSDERALRRERLLVLWQAGEVQVEMAADGQSMTWTFPRGHAELSRQGR